MREILPKRNAAPPSAMIPPKDAASTSLGFGVWSLEFGVWSLGLKVQYLESRV